MAIADDISTDINGNMRWTGDATTRYTVLQFHRDYIAVHADDAQAAGDDLMDITTDTPSDKRTDQILVLNSPFNIDDALASHLYDGSVSQDNGDTLYSGFEWVGTVAAGTEIMVVQDDKVLPSYWGSGINADAALSIIMRTLIKTRDGGADIDGKRIRSLVKEFGDTWKEFQTTGGSGVSVAAVDSANDLNNATAIATVRGWVTAVFAESSAGAPFLIDIDNNGTPEEYYTELDKGSQTLNDTYEVAKLQVARAPVVLEDFTNTATFYIVDNATIVGQAQSFTSHAVIEELREARFNIRIGAGAPTGNITAELYASTAGVIPTGAVLATSEPVLGTAIPSGATAIETIFRFNDGYEMAASTQFCIVIRHANGDASNYFEVEGAAAGNTAGENAAEENPATTWTAAGAADLYFSVRGSEVMYGRAGELHRGITHEIVYDTEAGGPFSEAEIVFWGTAITYDGLSGSFTVGNYVQFQPVGGGTVKNGGKILKDTGTVLTVALENIAPTVALADNDIIAEVGTATTANSTATIVDANKAGGEGVLITLDDNGADGDLYIQLIHGSAPVDELPIEGRTSGATCLVNVTVTARTISSVWLGQSTGSNIIGAYGVGAQTTDVGSSDLFFDLTDTSNQPPNNVTNEVTGLVIGEDRVLVGPRVASALQKNQFTTDTALTAVNETIISIATVAIPTDTPGAGNGTLPTRLRVERDNGVWRRVPYSSYDAATPGNFTIDLADTGVIAMSVDEPSGEFRRAAGSFLDDGFEEDHRFTSSSFTTAGNNGDWTILAVTAGAITVLDKTGMVTEGAGVDENIVAIGMDYLAAGAGEAASGNDVFVAYMDKLAAATEETYTAVYKGSDQLTLTRIRDGGGTPIKTDEFNTVFGSTNSSVAAIRQSDA